jgi:arylsulfatase A-like enzyme/Flp pilus assembly protein TadD
VRRSLLGAVAIGLLAAGVALWWSRSTAFSLPRTAERNVLLVTIDTLRGDALGSYGGRAATPHLDALAARGARFTFAHSHAVLTLPSHATILTGRYPYEHGIRDNSGFRLGAGETTLASRLKSMGFSTGAFVSAFPLDQRYGLQTGFDAYDDRISEVGKTQEVAIPERRGDATVTASLDWIGRQSGRWFGWVHVFDPHAPYAPPDEWKARYPSDAYAAEVAWTDAVLAPLFASLEKQARPTLVVVTADHGESLGEHGELTHGVFAYEATLRVPLIVSEITPGRKATGGVRVDSPARHVDLLPTILDLVGAPEAPQASAGRSLVGAMTGGREDDRPLYFESMMPTLARGWAPLRGVIVGREKYIELPIRELYDLGTDPPELQNAASLRGDRLTVMQNVLRGFNVAAPGRPLEETAAARERLRALGYTSGTSAPLRDQYTEADDPKRLVELDRLLHTANDRFVDGRLDEAMAICDQVIKRRPDMADAYRQLAFLLWHTGRPEAAIGVLSTALARGVTQRSLQVKLGTYLAEAGAAKKAIALLEALPSDDTEVLNALGIAYAASGRRADAEKSFRRAMDLDPTNGLAHQNIGTLHLLAGDLPAAEKALREAIAIDPALAEAHTTLGVVLAQTNRRREAVDAWKRAVELEPTEYKALYNVTVELARQNRADEARQYGRQFITTAPPRLYASDIARIRQILGER